MKKKFAAMFMAAAMVFTMAACGQKADTPDTPSTDGSGDQSGAEAQTFVLGTCGPLTGGYAIYGQAVVNGAELAVEEINASDSAVKFTFLKQDDEGDGEKAINAYNDMMDKGMQVLVGPTTTGASIAVAAVTNTERTFMLTPSASSPDVTADKDNVFQVCFTDTNQGTGAADYIAENMAGAKVAIIYRNDDAYSQGIRDTFVKEAEAKGAFEIVSETTFTLATATDFSVQLTAAKNAGADVVFLPIYYEPASVILSQAKAMSYAPTFFGVDGMDGILTMKNFDTSLAEGVMLLTPFSANSEDAATQSFVKAYTEEFGVEPNQFAADAYDAVYIVKAALEKAGCTGDMTAPEICDAIVGVMTSLSVDGLTGKAMTWNAEGEVSKAPLAAVIENGQYVMK
ncbi:MAG: ABC transporter substrate-binding protein [Oscillospiraceae bacterium]|jgi:leucine-, isoleucine-, valine-, threonine-, and alanine-binding protein|nr:putative uncharacterized protein [Firmicutes bacterium CAG:129]